MEPRILTLEEAVNADIFWHEDRCKTYSPEYGRLSSYEGNSIVMVRLGCSGFAFEDARYYGSWWRCWSAKPTEEQRKAAQWNEHENGCWNCMNYDPGKEACTLRWNNMDESYYDPDLDEREPDEYCSDHEPDADAVWEHFFDAEG